MNQCSVGSPTPTNRPLDGMFGIQAWILEISQSTRNRPNDAVELALVRSIRRRSLRAFLPLLRMVFARQSCLASLPNRKILIRGTSTSRRVRFPPCWTNLTAGAASQNHEAPWQLGI